MKIVIDTKNNIAAPSGSISTPIWNQVLPVGSQGIEEVNGCSPKCSTPIARKKTTILPSHERAAAPTPIMWLSALLLFVNSTIRKNARMGGRGSNQIRVVVAITCPYHFIMSSSSATTVLRLR